MCLVKIESCLANILAQNYSLEVIIINIQVCSRYPLPYKESVCKYLRYHAGNIAYTSNQHKHTNTHHESTLYIAYSIDMIIGNKPATHIYYIFLQKEAQVLAYASIYIFD